MTEGKTLQFKSGKEKSNLRPFNIKQLIVNNIFQLRFAKVLASREERLHSMYYDDHEEETINNGQYQYTPLFECLINLIDTTVTLPFSPTLSLYFPPCNPNKIYD